MPLPLLSLLNGNKPSYSPFGQQRTTGEGSPLLTDYFDGAALDTTYRWDAAVIGGTGTATQTLSGYIIGCEEG